jgi:hypothetical protein
MKNRQKRKEPLRIVRISEFNDRAVECLLCNETWNFETHIEALKYVHEHSRVHREAERWAVGLMTGATQDGQP